MQASSEVPMKIKRYLAASMRQALAQVRAEQGSEAVILSSRRVDDGIEVVAAVDYDESLIAGAARRAATMPAGSDARPAAAPAEPPRREPRPVVAEATYDAMRREIRDLRRLLEGGFARLAWRQARHEDPWKAWVLDELAAIGLTSEVAWRIAESAPADLRAADRAQIPLALLARSLPLVEDRTCEAGGVVALVGPTGAGKTTTIAKLAARWCAQHGADQVALVSTDGFRIGAREQLRTFARILGVALHAADNGADLARVLGRVATRKLVLIDTAGFGPREPGFAEQLQMLRSGAAHARVLLALPAPSEAAALQTAVAAYRALAPSGCVLTKIDEAASLGAALSVAVGASLPIAYLCNGQRVPEDLHGAHRRRIWLVKLAAALRGRARPPAAMPDRTPPSAGVRAHA
jgi:flagellar biosynthesis protein FlhF